VTPTGSCHSYTPTQSTRSTTFTYEKTSPQLSRKGSSKHYAPRPDPRQEPLSRHLHGAEPLSRRSIESLSSLSSYQSNVSSRRTPTETDIVKVTLNCSRESSGITLGPNPQAVGVLVKSIAKSSPAIQKIWPQDMILEVEVEGRKYTQVSSITDQLNCSNCTVDVLVQRECPIYDEYCVKLEKPKAARVSRFPGCGIDIIHGCCDRRCVDIVFECESYQAAPCRLLSRSCVLETSVCAGLQRLRASPAAPCFTD